MGLRFRSNLRDSNGNIIDIQKKIVIKEVEIIGENENSLQWHEEYVIDKTCLTVQQLKWMF